MWKGSFVLLAITIWLCSQPILSAPIEDDLFLTPLIKVGMLDEARARAEDSTKLIRSGKDVKSYSGFFTIDETANSNLFFWFFPAQENPENAPVILWVNDVPGFSSLECVFVETGPFELDDKNNELRDRNVTWTKTHSMLYIDAPVGTGFSYTENDEAYANNSDEEAIEIYEALKQFFTLFNDFQPREFYLAGETYAASLIPYIARHIDLENARSDVKINLKGFIIGSPFFDFKQNIDRSQTLYNFGLIDEEQKKQFDDIMSKAVEEINKGNIPEGTRLSWSTIIGPGSLLENTTGFTDYRNALRDKPPVDEDKFQKFLDTKQVHNYLHVGLHKFVNRDPKVYVRFGKEFAGAHEDVIQEMLDKGYRVLMYGAQFDIVTVEESLARLVANLKWKGADNYSKAPRKIWRVNGEVAGYIKMADNFAYAMVRNAGKYAIRDQPEWVFDLVERFLYNKEF